MPDTIAIKEGIVPLHLYQKLGISGILFVIALGCSRNQPSFDPRTASTHPPSSQGSASDKASTEKGLEEPEVFPPSLLRLLVHPEQYHGKQVSIVGFLRVRFEDNAIYLSEEDDAHMMTCNALWVAFEDNAMKMPYDAIGSKFSQRYVSLSGTFDMTDRGHFCGFQGTIKNVTNLQLKLGRSDAEEIRQRSAIGQHQDGESMTEK